MTIRRLGMKAIKRWRQDGIISFFLITINWLQIRTKRLWIRKKYGYTILGDTVINVEPERITHYLVEGQHPATSYRNNKGFATKHELSKAYFPIKFFRGVVISGDWDKHKKPHRFDRLYRGIRDRWVKGKEWEETEYGCHLSLLADLYDWNYNNQLDRCESLYCSIMDNGYEPASRPTKNVPVNIGRNGELIFNNKEGHHRLAFAKILDIERIPVVVVVRHKQWQMIREEVAAADSITNLSQRMRQYLDHPDVKHLHDFDQDRSESHPMVGAVRQAYDLIVAR